MKLKKLEKGKIIVSFGKLFKNHRRVIIISLIILLTIIGSWYFLVKRSGKEKTSQWQTTEVQKGTIVSSISASGNVINANTFFVTTSASGVVKKVYVKEGERVRKGQKIAEIDLDAEGARAYASAYANYISAVNSLKSAENNYRLTQITLERVYDEIKGHDQDETFEIKEARTKAEVANDNAYDAIQTARAKLSSVILDYQKSSPVIIAPASGIITSIILAEGMNLYSQESASDSITGQRIAVIKNEGFPLGLFNLSEVDIPRIKIGQKATMTLDGIPDKTFTGKIVAVDRNGAATSGVTNYPVIIQFDTSSEEILPNMTATAEIITEIKENVLWVPPQAIKNQAGQTIVRVLVNGKSQVKEVVIGLETSSQTEIISGLSEGETIVVNELTTQEETTFGGERMGIIRGFGGPR